MDYDAFMDLHELLKPGINEFISNNNNNQINYRTLHDLLTFYIHNGEIRLEIHFGSGFKVLLLEAPIWI